MVKVFEINSVPYGSTGRIMFQIAEKVKDEGGAVITACSYTKSRKIQYPSDHYQIGGVIDKFAHIQLAKLTGRHGCFSIGATRKLIKRIREFEPDLIHLHNLHEGYLNIQLFFDFMKSYGKPVIWTLHDCWAFTGHCPHFTFENCDKWKTQCHDCPKYDQYPVCKIDDSAFQYELKKTAFQGIPDMTIVTPSLWLAELVKQSFLKEYPVKVIHNGINLDVFKPTESDFCDRYNLDGKIIVLGVAFDWGIKKGLDVFKKLANDLDDRFAIVMVGVRQKVKAELPERIIAIECTQNQKELAEIYTAADVFVNPTLEDNYPTVNMEALACGTPVITYKTGGSPETIDNHCGILVDYGDYSTIKCEILKRSKKNNEIKTMCLRRSKFFSQRSSIESYLKLFKK